MTSKRKLFLSSSSTKKKEVINLNLSSSLISEFVLNPDATTFLQKIKGPIGLVAVAGMYRTGKSYLLNRMLLNRSNGFGVGPTINPCTKVRLRLSQNSNDRIFKFGSLFKLSKCSSFLIGSVDLGKASGWFYS
jgi:hypothetical protein